MTNLYRQIQRIADQYSLSMEDVIHALTATVHGNCCTACSEKVQSDVFLEDFDRMAQAFAFCKQLSGRPAA